MFSVDIFTQLLSHPFITKYENDEVDLAAFVRGIFDPTQRMKDLADVSCFPSTNIVKLCLLIK